VIGSEDKQERQARKGINLYGQTLLTLLILLSLKIKSKNVTTEEKKSKDHDTGNPYSLMWL